MFADKLVCSVQTTSDSSNQLGTKAARWFSPVVEYSIFLSFMISGCQVVADWSLGLRDLTLHVQIASQVIGM